MNFKTVSLPYGLVDMAIQQGWSKQLAYYSHIATLYSNKLIYSYSSRKLAVDLGVSHGTVNTQVQFLTAKGLLSFDGGSLRCASTNELRNLVVKYTGKETGLGLLKIRIHNKILHTDYNICARVVINNIRQQKYIIKRKNEVNAIGRKISSNSFVTKKEITSYNKTQDLISTKRLDETLNDKCMLSDMSISKMLKGKCVTSVRAMISFWVEQGLIENNLIKGKTLETKVSPLSHKYMKDYNPIYASTYLYKGRVIEYNKRITELGSVITPQRVSEQQCYITNKQLLNMQRNCQ